MFDGNLVDFAVVDLLVIEICIVVENKIWLWLVCYFLDIDEFHYQVGRDFEERIAKWQGTHVQRPRGESKSFRLGVGKGYRAQGVMSVVQSTQVQGVAGTRIQKVKSQDNIRVQELPRRNLCIPFP